MTRAIVAVLFAVLFSASAQAVIVCDRQGCHDDRVIAASPSNDSGHYHAATGKGVSRSCLTAQTRAILNHLEARFGTVKVISTCRKGAVIAGTNKPSYHRYGKAVDFVAPAGRKAEVVRWLYENNDGLVMIYAKMGHVHFDTGSYHKIACGGCGKKKDRKAKAAYAAAR